eukprot:576781-Pelagomonas_calceolata.AAC.1
MSTNRCPCTCTHLQGNALQRIPGISEEALAVVWTMIDHTDPESPYAAYWSGKQRRYAQNTRLLAPCKMPGKPVMCLYASWSAFTPSSEVSRTSAVIVPPPILPFVVLRLTSQQLVLYKPFAFPAACSLSLPRNWQPSTSAKHPKVTFSARKIHRETREP